MAMLLVESLVSPSSGPETGSSRSKTLQEVGLDRRTMVLKQGDALRERLTPVTITDARTAQLMEMGLGLSFVIEKAERAGTIIFIPLVVNPASQDVQWRVVWDSQGAGAERYVVASSNVVCAHIARADSFDLSEVYKLGNDPRDHVIVKVPGIYFSSDHMTVYLDPNTSLATTTNRPRDKWINVTMASYGVEMIGRSPTVLTTPKII